MKKSPLKEHEVQVFAQDTASRFSGNQGNFAYVSRGCVYEFDLYGLEPDGSGTCQIHRFSKTGDLKQTSHNGFYSDCKIIDIIRYATPVKANP